MDGDLYSKHSGLTQGNNASVCKQEQSCVTPGSKGGIFGNIGFRNISSAFCKIRLVISSSRLLSSTVHACGVFNTDTLLVTYGVSAGEGEGGKTNLLFSKYIIFLFCNVLTPHTQPIILFISLVNKLLNCL